MCGTSLSYDTVLHDCIQAVPIKAKVFFVFIDSGLKENKWQSNVMYMILTYACRQRIPYIYHVYYLSMLTEQPCQNKVDLLFLCKMHDTSKGHIFILKSEKLVCS